MSGPARLRPKFKSSNGGATQPSTTAPIIDRLKTASTAAVLAQFRRRAGKHTVTTDPFFMSVQKEGFRLIFNDGKEPVQLEPPPSRLDAEKHAAFDAEHQRLTREVGCTKLVRAVVDRATEPEFLHPVFAIWQGSKYRSIYNIKQMNPSLVTRKFKMTGVATWKSLIFRDMYMASIDIKDAYLHIPIHKASRRFLRYVWEGNVWELHALPFGLSQAPWVFTRLLQPLLQGWRVRLSVNIISWLDDIVLGHASKAHLRWAVQEILDDLSRVGLAVNAKPGKSFLVPTRKLTWCGITWDTKAMMAYVPTERRKNVQKAAAKLLRRALKGPVLARELAVVTGKIQACAEAILPQRAYSMELVRALGQCLRRTQSYDSRLRLTQEALLQLRWWKEQMPKWNGRSWAGELPEAAVLTTDASPLAWGAILEVFQTALVRPLDVADLRQRNAIIDRSPIATPEQGLAREGVTDLPRRAGGVQEGTANPNLTKSGQRLFRSETSGFFSPKEALRSQNEREALAVRFALSAFEETLAKLTSLHPQGRLMGVKILQDNSSVVQTIRRMGSSKKGIGEILEASLREAFEKGMQLRAAWIPGLEMQADPLSRELALQDSSNWVVAQRVYDRVCQLLEVRPEVDLFASRLNRKTTRFFSLHPDPLAMDFDALSEDKNWSKFKLGYAAPPTKLIPKVLRKIRVDEASVMMIVPRWTSAPWWQTLMSLAANSKVINIQVTKSNFRRVGQGINPQSWPGKYAVAVVASYPQMSRSIGRTGEP